MLKENRVKRNPGFALVVVLMTAAVAQAQTESRQRFVVINGDVKFNVTRIERIGEIHSATIVLVRDESDGKSYRLESNRNYSAQTAEYRLIDLASKEYQNAIGTADQLRAATRSTAVVNMTLSTARDANGEPCSKEQNQRAQDIRRVGRGNRY